MRNLVINIYPRPNAINANGQQDNNYIFNSQDSFNPDSVYQFSYMNLNYSLISSSVTSLLILTMNTPYTIDIALRSGQPIEITDNGDTIFQGTLLNCQYRVLPITEENSMAGMYVMLNLAPSILQLVSTPMLFSGQQAQQVQQLTGINVTSILAGGVAQQISSSSLINYMITNTDYSAFFGQSINVSDLPANVFVMAAAGMSRDAVLRSSIDFANVVFYQSENGIINIRQLDATIAAPFGVDLTNQFNDSEVNTTTPTIPMLEYDYYDNAATTSSVVSNYNMLPAGTGIALNATANLLSYKPNPTFYPRIDQLAKTGWFVGEIGQTQINDNIITDPTAAEAFNGYQSYPDQYIISSNQLGATEDSITAYQALLTAKQLATSLTGYASLQGVISLDDPNISIQQNMGSVLGTILKIQNCDMQSGIITTCVRNYSLAGSYLSFNLSPLGSITGFWKA